MEICRNDPVRIWRPVVSNNSHATVRLAHSADITQNDLSSGTVVMGKYLRASDTPLYIALSFIVIVFLLGGGARHDISSLVFLRPISVVALTYAALVINRAQVKEFIILWSLAVITMCMVILHLVPLPPTVWMSLPNRELSEIVGRTVGIEQPWRPISLVPYRTFNLLFSLFIPFAGLALMTKLTSTQQYRVLPALIAMGGISALIGALQLAGPPGGMFYFYKITNEASPVGLFSNRNHQSIFLACCIPLLTVLACTPNSLSSSKHKLLMSFSILLGMLFIMIILINGSRSGLFLGFLGLMSVPFLAGHAFPNKSRHFGKVLSLAVVGIAATLIFLSTWFARGESLARITDFESSDELRLMVWPSIFQAAVKYFPVGSGFGTFEEVYKVEESSALLSLTYLNHAHNDWLEIFLTGGLPALIFAMTCLMGWGIATGKLFRNVENASTGIIFGRLGVIVIFLLGVASIFDYPLRTPSLSLLFTISAVWVVNGLRCKVQSASLCREVA